MGTNFTNLGAKFASYDVQFVDFTLSSPRTGVALSAFCCAAILSMDGAITGYRIVQQVAALLTHPRHELLQ